MLQITDDISLGILIILCIIVTFLLNFSLNKKNKKQLDKIFSSILVLFIVWILCMIMQIICIKNQWPIKYAFCLSHFGVCFIPVGFLFLAFIFSNTKIKFTKKHALFFIIPVLSIILVLTNDFHHLFYKDYVTDFSPNVIGPYFYVHTYYTYALFIISAFILLKYSIKNSGFFSRQATFILIGILVPVVVNVLGFMNIITMSAYLTPITFTFSILFFALAIFKFNFLGVAPIALQTIVDRISDSFVILNEDYEVTDYNATFIKTFKIKDASSLRGKHFAEFLNEIGLKEQIPEFGKYLEKIDVSKRPNRLELSVKKANKIFNIEITSIISKGNLLGILILFKDITQHKNDMQSLKNNQDLLIEQERLASLGQMIGGIAHNLKTPIFSVAGGLEGLSDLVKEYDESIDDPNVTNQGMHDIAKDMNEWIGKLKDHISYMSDVITTVKGQAVNMSEEEHILFPVSELFQHVNILMQHEIKEKLAELEVKNKVPDIVKINGNINSLVQVINNLISNAIEAYGDAPTKKVVLSSEFKGKEVIISVKDFGPGLPDEVQKKLFKEMITTKGKDGTGLGLFMSYSNIKAHFNGTITYETSSNGTTFNIIIPIK